MGAPEDADAVIELLGLERHPEGGWYAETWRHDPGDGTRGAGSAIYFLLREGEVSRWHRLDADEVWHFHAGGPLELRIAGPDRSSETVVVGTDLADGQRPQVLVPARAWQSAATLGAYTLVGVTVSPAFVFDGFELAPEGWEPSAGQ